MEFFKTSKSNEKDPLKITLKQLKCFKIQINKPVINSSGYLKTCIT